MGVSWEGKVWLGVCLSVFECVLGMFGCVLDVF